MSRQTLPRRLEELRSNRRGENSINNVFRTSFSHLPLYMPIPRASQQFDTTFISIYSFFNRVRMRSWERKLLSRLPPNTPPRHSKPHRAALVTRVPPSQGRPINCRIQAASRIHTRRHSMDVLDASTLDSEQVTVRHCLIRDGSVQPGEPHKQIDGPVLLIDNVAAVRNLDTAWKAADGAGLAGRVALAGVGATLEPCACRAPGDLDADVVEPVEVGVSAGLDHGACILLLHWDRVPVLDRVPVEVTRGVEEPVALVGHDRLHVRDLAIIGVENPRTDNVRVIRVGHDELGEGGALDGVMDASVVVDVEGLS